MKHIKIAGIFLILEIHLGASFVVQPSRDPTIKRPAAFYKNGIVLYSTAILTESTTAGSRHDGFATSHTLLQEDDEEYDQLSNFDDAFEKIQWLMPSIVERSLIHEEQVDPYELLQRLDMSTKDRDAALEALEVGSSPNQPSTIHALTIPSVLTPTECDKLINFIEKQIKDDGYDNVDGCPDWQINITSKKLNKILGGSETLQRLYDVPSMVDSSYTSDRFERVGIFLRMYQRNKRPWMPFHSDGNAFTVNVALNDDNEYRGGKLMVLHKDQVDIVERNQGDATCHRGTVYHGVSAMRSGTRYSMICFFHEK